MGKSATVFNAAITNVGTKWSVAVVTTFESMFEGASSFDQPLNTWTLGATSTTGLKSMFKNAGAFNSLPFTVNNGVQTAATDVTSMFEGAAAFNQDISSWIVTSVTLFTSMFEGASGYNRDLSIWDVDAGTNFHDMFKDASIFQQNLCLWQGANGITTIQTNAGTFEGTNCVDKTVDAD